MVRSRTLRITVSGDAPPECESNARNFEDHDSSGLTARHCSHCGLKEFGYLITPF